MDRVKVHVVGAGSLGTLFAAYLAKGGAEVSVAAKPGQLAALGREGIVVRRAPDLEPFHVSGVHFHGDLSGCGASDAILIAVKAFDVGRVLEELRARVSIDPTRQALCLMQNGIGIEDATRKMFPDVPLLRVSTTNGALLERPGVVSHTGTGDTFIGYWDDRRSSASDAQLDEMVDVLETAGLPVGRHGNMRQRVFEKCIVNAGINAVGAIFGVPNGTILEVPPLREISRRLTGEAVAVGRASGNTTTFDGQAAVKAVLEHTSANRNSMLQDLDKGGRTEIDFINGAIVTLGNAHGIDVAWNEFAATSIHGIESLGRRRPREVFSDKPINAPG